MASNIGSSSISQSIVSQLQLQQAQRNAEQARKNADALKSQADEAQSVADRAQESARSLRSDADQAQTDATRADMGLQTQRSFTQMREQQQAVHTQVVERKPTVQPTVNVQGEITGQVVNVTA